MSRRTLAAAALSVALHLCVSKGNPPGLIEDDSVNILLARSLAGGAFALPDAGGVPITDPLPGLSLLLLPAAALVRPHWGWLRGMSLLALAAALFFSWRLIRKLGGPSGPWLFGLIAVNPVLARHAGLVLADLPFMAVCLGVFDGLAFPAKRPSPARLAALAGGAAAASLLRPQGALLIPAAALGLSRAIGARNALLWAAASGLPLAGWLLRNAAVAGEPTAYATHWFSQAAFLAAPGVALRHAASLSRSLLGEGWLGWSGPGGTLLGVAGLLAAVRGAVVLGRDPNPEGNAGLALSAFTACYLTLHLTWGPAPARYALPLVPLLWILAAAGTSGPRLSKARGWAGAALTCVALLSSSDLALRGARRPWEFQPATMEWIRSNTPPEARWQSLRFNALILWTGRAALPPPLDATTAAAWGAAAARDAVGYALIEDSFLPGGYLPPEVRLLARELPGWARDRGREIYRNEGEGTTLFKLGTPAASAHGRPSRASTSESRPAARP